MYLKNNSKFIFSYNNQWMILDYNKFHAGKPLEDGLLWVLEQMP